MAVKIDIKWLLILILLTLLQVTYMTWSFLSDKWSVTKSNSDEKQTMAIRQIAEHQTTSIVLRHQEQQQQQQRYSTITAVENAVRMSRLDDDDDNDDDTEDENRLMIKQSRTTKTKKNDQFDSNDEIVRDHQMNKSDHRQHSSIDRNLSTKSQPEFILNKSKVCSASLSPPPLALIVVCSSPENVNNRNSIRQTWAANLQEPEMKILFLIGRHLNSTSFIDRILEENDKYDDIILADFIDSYSNLSRKSIMMLYWTLTYCSSARFLVKTDDDTFLNTPLLTRDLRKTVHHRFIMGNVIALAKPVRDPNSKWFTPISVFNQSSYPTYVSGTAYVISNDVIKDLYDASLKIPLFWLEDVYITGLLAEALKIQLIFNGKFDGFKELLNVCSMRSHIVRHRIRNDQMETLWSIVRNTTNYQECPQMALR